MPVILIGSVSSDHMEELELLLREERYRRFTIILDCADELLMSEPAAIDLSSTGY